MPLSEKRRVMDAAYDEWEEKLRCAPTLKYLYAVLKEGERDMRLSLAQKHLLWDVYREKTHLEGWSWE